jgi:hypothetical protein
MRLKPAGNVLIKVGIVLLMMSFVNATIATLLGIEIPYWKAIIYNIGHFATGGLVVYFVLMGSMKQIVSREVDELRCKGCTHPACYKKQKYELN